MAIVTIAVTSFGYILARFGLFPATTWMVGLSSLADPRPKPLRIVLSIIVLCAFGYLVFIRIFGLPIQPIRF